MLPLCHAGTFFLAFTCLTWLTFWVLSVQLHLFLGRKPIRERSPHLPSWGPIAFHLVEWTGVPHDYLRAANPQAHTHTHCMECCHCVGPSHQFPSVLLLVSVSPVYHWACFKISQTAQKWSPTIKIHTGCSGVRLEPDSSKHHHILFHLLS